MIKYAYFLIFALGILFQCSEKKEEKNAKPTIVCTTGMIADAVKNIVGDSAEVMSLMGAGVDPHLYKATQGDLEKLSNANIIFYNGLHLEGKMGEILEKLSKRKAVVAFAEGIPKEQLRFADSVSKTYDPHIWFDVKLWALAVKNAGKMISELDPNRQEYYLKNTDSYLQKLESLHTEVQKNILQIPENQRVLITSHDAFGYFGRAYKIQVRGLQGISTVADFGLNDITELVKFINEKKVKAIFVETSVSQKSIEAVLEGCQSKGQKVVIGGSLHSDAMGATGTPEGTYIGMVQANTNLIIKALQ